MVVFVTVVVLGAVVFVTVVVFATAVLFGVGLAVIFLSTVTFVTFGAPVWLLGTTLELPVWFALGGCTIGIPPLELLTLFTETFVEFTVALVLFSPGTGLTTTGLIGVSLPI